MEWISVVIGDKTTAFFDLWSVQHVLSGVAAGFAVRRRNFRELSRFFGGDHTHHSWLFAFTGVLAAAFGWETVEHYIEAGLLGDAVTNWFHGVEYWGNRIIADPALMVLGYAIAYHWPRFVTPARITSAAWILIHVLLFPDSMYLQRLLFGGL